MTQQPNPVLIYHPDAYQVAREDLKGRHSAGESFLAAYLAQQREREIYGLCLGDKVQADFVQAVKSSGPAHTAHPVRRTEVSILRKQGLLYLPYPGLAEEARRRSFLGDNAYALSGVTHTISSREVLEGVASMLTAPVREWDALICTSKPVHQALSTVLDLVQADLRARLGATQFTRPLMPVIPLGIHTDRFVRKDKDRATWRRKLGLGKNTTAILFFGRLSVHAKASPFQLAQAAQLAAERSGKRFAIIWCGWFSNDFQRRVFMETAKQMAPSVDFHHVDGRDAGTRFSIWAAADVFCSLTDNIQESFGLTVVEAMAAGLPVIASDWDGYRETVVSGSNGILIDSYLPKTSLADIAYRYISGAETYDQYIGSISQLCFLDLEQTAEALLKLASDETFRRELGKRARKAAVSSFDWKAVLPRYFELWGEQLARRGQVREAASSSWKALDPGIVFSSFPSRHLTDKAKLSRGKEFPRWDELIRQPGVLVNDSALCGRAQLQKIRASFAEKESFPLRDLLSAFPEAERAVVFRSLHWLVKSGLIGVSE